MDSNLILIGNPASGRGAGAASLARAEALLRERGREVRVLRTDRPGHAVQLGCEAAREDPEVLLVSGGDGTVRDVAEGVSRAGSAVPLGILPGGTGNDLCRTLGVPLPLEAALEVALSGRARTLDLWQWNETCFLNVAGLGLDAAVAREVNARFRNMRGTLPYVLALLSVLPRFRPQELRLTWPGGEWSGSAWLAAFGNGRYYGGGMAITPQAEPDDGLLDVVVIGAVSKLELLRELPGLFQGRHVAHPGVTSQRAASFQVEAAAQDATIDGELIGHAPAAVTLSPHKVSVRVPDEIQ